MRIAVIGPGLIGRSISLAALRADPGADVTEIDRDGPLDAARGADLIVLATPVDVILDIIRHHSDVLRSSVVIDVGSTKRVVLSAAREAGLTTFVGGHPMAGAATSGPRNAQASLFDGRPFFLFPAAATDVARRVARNFVAGLGAHPVVMEDDGVAHDRAMAAVSHLPQLVASTLMVIVAEVAPLHLQWAGNGLRDTTRLAQSSAHVWQPILDSNAAELRPLVLHLARQLESIADKLGDGHSAGELLDKANRARALI